MHEELIINAFSPLHLSCASHPDFFEMWQEVSFKKHELITEYGKKEAFFYIVINGVQAIQLMSADGEEKVLGFSYDGSFSGVYDSFLQESISSYNLVALTNSKLLRVRKKDYDSWFEQYPEFDRWGRIAHQNLLMGRVQREVELISLSAKERFEKFMERCPDPLKLIPQKYLASYLNMTPETFSRLRAQIS